MFDVFYTGPKPNLFPHEQPAKNMQDAVERCRTRLCWFINGDNDYTDFDFEYMPPPWEWKHTHVWPSQHSRNGGVYLVNPVYILQEPLWHFHDSPRVTRKPNMRNWKWKDIDVNKFDWSWHPDEIEGQWIYEFGTQWHEVGGPQFIMDGASTIRYCDAQKAERIQCERYWRIPENICHTGFDYSWYPDPRDEPLNYEFGTQWQGAGGPRFEVEGATETKYMTFQRAVALRQVAPWNIMMPIEQFDFSWHPDPRDPPYIYVFGNQWWPAEIMPTLEYRVEGATEKKYMHDPRPMIVPTDHCWQKSAHILEFDYSWHPNPFDPPYIYVFGTQWQKTGGPVYVKEGATETKYVDFPRAVVKPTKDNWVVPDDIDEVTFDFSWHPDNTEPAYNYQFGTQWQKTGGPLYVVEGATETKYVDEPRATRKPVKDGWVVPDNISDFDFSWHPDATEPPYMYQFGTQWQPVGGPYYVVEGATEIKYVDSPRANRLPVKDNWVVPDGIDATNFDFSWHPDARHDPLIYEFGTQWQPNGGPKYVVPGASETKCIDFPRAKNIPSLDNWEIPPHIDPDSFDFSWHPDANDPPLVYQFGTQWQKTGGPKYVSTFAKLGESEVKYVDQPRCLALPDPTCPERWEVIHNVAEDGFDWSWHPDSTEQPYIYAFGNKWYSAETDASVIYNCPGATEVKFMQQPIATITPTMENWTVPDNIDPNSFDFSWYPNPFEEPYIYQFGTQWERAGGPVYTVPGATQIKYCDVQRARAIPVNNDNWSIPENVDTSTFDFSWHPDSTEAPYIYEFGTQWQSAGGPRYIVPGATEVKYVDQPRIVAKSTSANWEIPDTIEDFDYSWHPDPRDPPYIYQFGTQWQKTGGPRYNTPGATEIKYISEPRAKRKVVMDNWHLDPNTDYSTFDFSWHPDDSQLNFKHVFGTQWQRSSETYWGNENDPVNYVTDVRVTSAHDKLPRYYITSTLDALVNEHQTEKFWALNKEMDYGDFDFTWHPDSSQSNFVHVFGSQWQRHSQTYLVDAAKYLAGNKEFNYVADVKVKSNSKLSIFYINKGNSYSQARAQQLKAKYPQLQVTRLANGWMETIKRCCAKSETERFWVISSDLDYSEFDFNWHPEPWQANMTQVFGSKWQKWSDTFLVNKWEFERVVKWCKDIKEMPNLNFVQDQRVGIPEDINDVYFIDMSNDKAHISRESIKRGNKDIVRYYDSYLETLRRIVNAAEEKEWIWIASSVCDYSRFDFSWQPEPWQANMLHVFPSDEQKFGDTFYLHIPSFKEKSQHITTLNDYPDLNFVTDQHAVRIQIPVIYYITDSIVDAIKEHHFDTTEIIFAHAKSIKVPKYEPLCLWAADTKTVQPLTRGGGIAIVPREAAYAINTQVYDYPYVVTNKGKLPDTRQDVIFLSNGEAEAEKNWEHLKSIAPHAKHVKGVNGRSQAYKAAAAASDTPWFFTVFAKLHIYDDFDWDWQPDRFQQAKHYIFYAKNPVNNLEYGHMGLIVYNKDLTLRTKDEDVELDFTLAAPLEVVPITSGVANFNTDPYNTWRAAFREVVKLKHFTVVGGHGYEAELRLKTWLTVANDVPNAQWALQGASDAIKYYEEVNGELAELKKSYEWAWLSDFWSRKNYKQQ